MIPISPLNLMKWVNDNRDQLKPPVGNKLIWKDREFTVMIVGGPNQRKDYHVNPGEEFFYQIEGDMVLRVWDEGGPKDIPIKAGEIFLLPPNIPHSPQRPANTVGLVIERFRRKGEEFDSLRWYCDSCKSVLYEETFYCTDLGVQLRPVIQKFFGDEKLRTCKKCGTVMSAPPPVK